MYCYCRTDRSLYLYSVKWSNVCFCSSWVLKTGFCVCDRTAFLFSSLWVLYDALTRARTYSCEICLRASACMQANVRALYISFSQWLLFSCIRRLRAVERFQTVNRQKWFGTSAIQGPWKCTHSLAQLVERGIPAWQISTQNVSW